MELEHEQIPRKKPPVFGGLPHKLTRPRFPAVFERTRLYGLLDEMMRAPMVWVESPAGAGKTTLASRWIESRKRPCLWYQIDCSDMDIASLTANLTRAARTLQRSRAKIPAFSPEHMLGIDYFARQYFAALYGALPQETVIVFDNMHVLPAEGSWHQFFCAGFALIPDGVRILCLSRQKPPECYAQLQLQHNLLPIGWDVLRLTAEETQGILKLNPAREFTECQIKTLHEISGGWPIAITIMQETLYSGGALQALPEEVAPSSFEYIASEVFSRFSYTEQIGLLQCAMMPALSADEAMMLTLDSNAGKLLAQLAKGRFLTEMRPGKPVRYTFHPLFRQFLLERGKRELDSDTHRTTALRAVELLKKMDDADSVATLLNELAAWEFLAKHIVETAPRYFNQGRIQTVAQWLVLLPDTIRVKSPWLLYWMGSCRLPIDPLEAREYYVRAFQMMDAIGDVEGLYLSWAGIAETFIYLWGDFTGMKPWLVELEALQRRYPNFPTPEIEARVLNGAFSTLYYVDPANALITPYRQRVEVLMCEVADPNFKCNAANALMVYYAWFGTVSEQQRIADYIAPYADHPDAAPLARIVARLALAGPEWMSGNAARAHALCDEGLQIASLTGVKMINLLLVAFQVHSAAIKPDLDAMGLLLERMRSYVSSQRALDGVHYNLLMSRYLGMRGRYDEALALNYTASVAFDLSVVTAEGFVRNNKGLLLILAGRFDEAAACLNEATEFLRRNPGSLVSHQCGFARAALAHRRGDEEACVRELRYVLPLAEQHGHGIFSIYINPTIMSELCAVALRREIEVDYVRKLILNMQIQPPAHEVATVNWPYPVKLYVLGRFDIECEGEEKESSRKSANKPLELLALLITSGERGVSVERAAESLWPDQGKKGYQAYAVALHRLRKLLGEECIVTSESQVRIATERVWVDAFVFERCTVHKSEPDVDRLRQAIELYQGVFLDDRISQPWAIAARERLHTRFIRAVTELGRYYEQRKEYEAALAVYELGVERDPLIEHFHQRIIASHTVYGHRAEGIAAYERCRRQFLESLGVGPSTQTRTMYELLLKG